MFYLSISGLQHFPEGGCGAEVQDRRGVVGQDPGEHRVLAQVIVAPASCMQNRRDSDINLRLEYRPRSPSCSLAGKQGRDIANKSWWKLVFSEECRAAHHRHHGTPTKRQVSKRQVSKRLVSKCPVSKRQVYKTSGLQNVRFQNVWFQNVWFQNVTFLNLIYLLNKKYWNCQVCIPI